MVSNTGLVLEGGAMRGVFSAGVIDYILEEKLEIPYVVGVSAGACSALNYASKQKGRTYKCMLPAEDFNQIENIKEVIKRKTLFDMDLLFDDYPNKIYPFDFETFKNKGVICELVVTNCITGKAEYLTDIKDMDRLMNICRASSSLPMVSPIVYVDGIPYLDGGLSDSVPIIHSLKAGNKKT